MVPKLRFCQVLDFVGLGALAGAGVTFVSGTIFPLMPEAMAFSGLFGCISVGVFALLVSRVFQIAKIVSLAPTAQNLRAAVVADNSNVLPVTASITEVASKPDFQRAA